MSQSSSPELLQLCADPEWAARTILDERFRADRLEAVVREIAFAGTDQPAAMGIPAEEWYRDLAYSLIGLAARALESEQQR